MFLYHIWDIRRFVRIIFANLPFFLKTMITKAYLKIYSWLYQQKILPESKIKLADVYFSDDLKNTRIFVAICQKREKNE